MICPICDNPLTDPVVIDGVTVCDGLCADLQDAGGYANARAGDWPPAGRVVCLYCEGTGLGKGEWHYVRGHGIRNDCPNHRCDGRGHVPADSATSHPSKFHGIAAE